MRDGQAELDDIERMETDDIEPEAKTVENEEAKGKEVKRTVGIESTTTNLKTTSLSSCPIPKIQRPTMGTAIRSSSSKTPQPNTTSRSNLVLRHQETLHLKGLMLQQLVLILTVRGKEVVQATREIEKHTVIKNFFQWVKLW